ncbi:MAG TPA: carbohydrate ABC transporter permease [Candidatus Caccomorpha excrementavium]|nr:carbohydrate ABC transporter permease [Candidatus Caccomorpha excrementavium]
MAKHIRVSGKLNRSYGGNLIIFIMLVLVGLFMGLPLFYNIVSAFKQPSELFIFPPRFYVSDPTLSNFTQLFQLATNLTVPFNRYLFNSIFVSIASTALCVLIGALAAYPFAKKDFPGKKMLWNLIMMTLLFSGGVTSLPSYIVKAKLGLINTYWVLILPSIASTLQMFLMRQFMLQIPDSLLEAARIDGASEFKTFLTIVMPNVKPAWLTVMVLAFTGIWNTGSNGVIFEESLKLLPSALSQISAGGIARTGVTAAATLLLMIPPILAFVVTQSKMLQTMAHSGIKE